MSKTPINQKLLTLAESQQYSLYASEYARLNKALAEATNKDQIHIQLSNLQRDFESWKSQIAKNQSSSNRLAQFSNHAVFHHNPLQSSALKYFNFKKPKQSSTHIYTPAQTARLKISSLDSLLLQVNSNLTPDARSLLLQAADSFIDSVCNLSCKAAIHSGRSAIDPSDISLVLEKCYGINPGIQKKDYSNIKPKISSVYNARMNAIRKVHVKRSRADVKDDLVEPEVKRQRTKL